MAKERHEWSDPANGSWAEYCEHEALMFRREAEIRERIRRTGCEHPHVPEKAPDDGQARVGPTGGDCA